MRAAIVIFLTLALGASAVLAQSGPTPVATVVTKPGKAPPAKSPASKNTAADAIAECMRLWDIATHMTRQEWARTCRRIQTRLDNLKVENLRFDGAMPRTGGRKRGGG